MQRVTVSDLNIVTDRLDGDGLNLILATNVFVYYDVFDQVLALAKGGISVVEPKECGAPNSRPLLI